MDSRVVSLLKRLSTRTSTAADILNIRKKLLGIVTLLFITILWGSSFPIIKVVVSYVNSFCYIFYRNIIALLALTPYLLYKIFRRSLERDVIKGGLITGLAYTSALWLQGWGTEYTSATCSAFITGLNVIFVHIYVMLFERKRSNILFIELLLAVSGLYLITKPSDGILLGNLIVLVSSIFWAIQVILVSKYAPRDPILFTYFEPAPSLIYFIPTLLTGQLSITRRVVMLGLTYLAIVCTVIAFTLQAYGQRYVSSETAAIIYLFEPVAAAIFSHIFLGEVLDVMQLVGATMIIISITLATLENTYIRKTRASREVMTT